MRQNNKGKVLQSKIEKLGKTECHGRLHSVWSEETSAEGNKDKRRSMSGVAK